jgi:lipid-A-disaccharide synthase
VCAAREAQVDEVRRELGRFGPGFPGAAASGEAVRALTAADAAIVASGTIALEALLCRTPMVVGYRLAPLSYHIIRRMVSIPHIAMPNILARRKVVPELIQNDLTPVAIRDGLREWLDDAGARARFTDLSRRIHQDLRRGAARNAARVVMQLMRR